MSASVVSQSAVTPQHSLILLRPAQEDRRHMNERTVIYGQCLDRACPLRAAGHRCAAHPPFCRLVVPRPWQNGRKTTVTSGHSRAPRTASDLGARRLTPCAKRTSKQQVAPSWLHHVCGTHYYASTTLRWPRGMPGGDAAAAAEVADLHAAPQEVLAAAAARRNALGICVAPHPDTVVRIFTDLGAQSLAHHTGAYLARRALPGPVAFPVAGPGWLPGHTVRAHARLICGKLLAHYVFTVKLNTKKLWEELDALDWKSVPVQHATEEKGHGRRERRTIQVMNAPARIRSRFPHARQVALIERYVIRTVRVKKGKRWIRKQVKSAVAVFIITSLNAREAAPAHLAHTKIAATIRKIKYDTALLLAILGLKNPS